MAFPFSSPQAQDAFNGIPALEEFTFDFELSPCDSYPAPGEHNNQSFLQIQQFCDELCVYGCPHTLQSAPMARHDFDSMPLWPPPSIFPLPNDEAWSPTSPYGTNSSVSPSEAPLTPEWLFQSPLASQCQLPQAAPAVETFGGMSPDSFDLLNGCFVAEEPSQLINSASLSRNGTACSIKISPLSTDPNETLLNFVEPTKVQDSAPTNAKFQCGLCSYSCDKSYNFKRHMKTTHTQGQSFSCSYCPRVMSRADNMKQHELTCRKRPADAGAGPSSSSRKGSKPRREKPTGSQC